jgi:CAAX protease family protein
MGARRIAAASWTSLVRPMAAQRSHGWWPYLAPYGLFLIVVEIERRAPGAWAPWLLLLRVILPGAWLVVYARRGDLPELRGYRPTPGALAADVLCGLVIAALWMGPYLVFPSLPRPAPGEGFDAGMFGPGREGLALGIRLVGFAAVTPFMEELFVRSFLIRLVDVIDGDMDFRRLPIGRFTWRSFVVTVLWFTFTHRPWEFAVAPVAGVLFNLWLYRRRHIGATIVAHAVANAAIWLAVVAGPASLGVFL